MIFTSCPYCDHSQVFGYEAGDRTGYIPSRCRSCNNVMWVELISFGGETRSHEDFKEQIMIKGDESKVEQAALNAVDESCEE